MNQITIWVLLNIIWLNNVSGQALQIGKTLPDITLNNVINYKEESIKVKNYHGKALIIDFWNTHCTACFKAFPKLDSLQKLYSDEIQIILVSSESKQNVIEFFKAHSKIFKPDLPMVTSDKKVSNLFPADGYPYTVWIDKNGIVRYFSGAHSVTKSNLANFLIGRDLTFKDPTLVKYGSAIDKTKFEFYSSIAHCYDSLNIGNTEIIKIKSGTAISISSNCLSISDLYKKAYSENDKYSFSTTYSYILQVSDSFKYTYPSNFEVLDVWIKKNAYNYELVLPIEKSPVAYSIMQQDLERYFNLEARIEKRKINSLILIRKSHGYNSFQPGGYSNSKNNRFTKMKGSTDSVLYFVDITFQQFIRELGIRIVNTFPFFDETHYTGNINCLIRYTSLSPLNISALREDLKNSDLDIIEDKREIPVLIVKEKL